MRPLMRFLLLLACLWAGVHALAFSDPPPQEDPAAVREQNRRLLEKWRSDPEHFGRLQRDYRAFLALPPTRQAQLRQFDHDLYAEDPSTQARLWAVLERYVAWLDKLPESDRAWIESALHAKERLERVKVIRDKQWVKRLPGKVQEELEKLPEDKRPERIAELRGAERQRRLDWFWASHLRDLASLKRARPTRLPEFPPEVRLYYNSTLRHILPEKELQRLRDAEGNWPLYARTLSKAMETPPPELPGFADAKVWPTRFADLPGDWKAALNPLRPEPKGAKAAQKQHSDWKHRQELWRKLQSKFGKWPDFALTATSIVRAEKFKVTTQLGPNKLEHLPPAVQETVRRQLLPALTRAEKDDLAAKEGKWPDYPELLYELAKRHDLTMPGTVRPCPSEFWDAMTKLMPDVPSRALRNFVLTELSAEERGELKLAPDDAASRERLLDKYWARHLEEPERKV